jgi:hypothetical protein
MEENSARISSHSKDRLRMAHRPQFLHSASVEAGAASGQDAQPDDGSDASSAMSPAPAAPSLPLRRLACERCGNAFDCGSESASGQCWCMQEDYRLPMPDPAAGDCLCPACLRALARQLNGNSA